METARSPLPCNRAPAGAPPRCYTAAASISRAPQKSAASWLDTAGVTQATAPSECERASETAWTVPRPPVHDLALRGEAGARHHRRPRRQRGTGARCLELRGAPRGAVPTQREHGRRREVELLARTASRAGRQVRASASQPSSQSPAAAGPTGGCRAAAAAAAAAAGRLLGGVGCAQRAPRDV
jgi:hypothetical protein